MSSSGVRARVIATCLVSSQIMTSSSSFVLTPASISSRASINRHPHNQHFRTINSSRRTLALVCFKSTATMLAAVRSSGSDTSTQNISQMSLPQILQLLNTLNIRYPPDAARAELEELLYQYYKSSDSIPNAQSQSASEPSSTVQNNGPNIVDAVVLDDDKYANEEDYFEQQNEKVPVYNHQSQQSQDFQRSRPNNRTQERSSSYQQNYRKSSNQHRHRRRRRENYDLYNRYNPTDNSARRNDVIDLDTFDIPDEPNKQNDYYDNGAQIFLMGFLEAGKTATQLALDSVTEAINPFSKEKRWYDEERGREVLDVNILDYSPDYERRTQRRYSSETRGRRRQRRPGRSVRSYRGHDDMVSNIPPRRRRSVQRQHASNVEGRQKRDAPFTESMDIRRSSGDYVGDIGVNHSAQVSQATQNRKPRKPRARQDSMKPIYGLYNSDENDQPIANNLYNATEPHQEAQHPKKVWKKRLRKKFDAALGLQSPSSPSSSESLYESWKTQVDGVHDGRKKALRNEMNKKKLPTTPTRNNRRSRMRSQVNSSKVSSTAKSYLDEPPFWRRDGGTIASVLFDSKLPSSSTSRQVIPQSKRRYKYNNSLDTLEAILRSPLGRQNTVTSLVVFIARSCLSWFGSLCRWAGVRGTIPQPIVVTTVFAMGVSSRRGYRTLSLGLSLLALRMVGEFIHGSLHGNEFWEDDYNRERHEWTQE